MARARSVKRGTVTIRSKLGSRVLEERASLGESRETEQPVRDFGGRHLPLSVCLFRLA